MSINPLQESLNCQQYPAIFLRYLITKIRFLLDGMITSFLEDIMKKLKRGTKSITPGDVALEYVDDLVNEDIKAGLRGIEFIAINPMWRSSWKKFYSSIIFRSRSTNNATQSPNSPEEIDEAQSVQSEALTTDSECE